MSQHQSKPSKEFVETIYGWHQFNGDENIRIVIVHLARVIRQRQGTSEDASPIVASLRAAGAYSASAETRAIVLWNALPYLQASDQVHSTISTEVIWNFLMHQAQALGYLHANDIARFRSQRFVGPSPSAPSTPYRHRSDGPFRRLLHWLHGAIHRDGRGDDFIV